jgi:hypothetical protein
MKASQENLVADVHTGNLVRFELDSEFVKFDVRKHIERKSILEFGLVFDCGFVDFRFLGLFGSCVCGLGLTAEQVQGAVA